MHDIYALRTQTIARILILCIIIFVERLLCSPLIMKTTNKDCYPLWLKVAVRPLTSLFTGIEKAN